MDDDWLTANHRAAPRPTRPPGERAWRVTKDGGVISCELRDESKSGAGWDVFILQDGELSFSRRCLRDEHARFVAAATLKDHRHADMRRRRRYNFCQLS
jgi:hypothetical protein